MDENSNEMLNELFKLFKSNDLLQPYKEKITAKTLNTCFNALNQHFFMSKLPIIPLMYENDSNIRKFLMQRNMKSSNIPDVFFGVYSVLYDNDPNTLKWSDDLILHDDTILLNSSHTNGRSISFLVACLCHEMIHYYDRLYGEYCNFTKYSMITGIKKNKHNTMTFETMKDKANDLGINVIQDIPKDKNAEILDNEGIELLFKKANEEGLIIEGEDRTKSFDGEITAFNDRLGGSINTF